MGLPTNLWVLIGAGDAAPPPPRTPPPTPQKGSTGPGATERLDQDRHALPLLGTECQCQKTGRDQRAQDHASQRLVAPLRSQEPTDYSEEASCEAVDGRDLFARPRAGAKPYAFADNFQLEPWVANYTVYDRHHRLTWCPRLAFVEFFDHREDPGETRNLAGSPAARALEQHLLDRLGRHVMETADPTLGRLAVY